MQSILIIGGGAAGLMAAYELSKHKYPITILEAKKRLGGRIHTITDNSFSQPIEAGAEFIHGDLPLTISLLKKAGIPYHVVNDNMFQLEKGKLKKQKEFSDHRNKVMKEMEDLKEDTPLKDFLNTYFNDAQYEGLRQSIKNFAGGFDLADISKASTKALYREWSHEMGKQYRINGGYKQLVNYLETVCKENGCAVQTDCCVKKINWQTNEVSMLTMCSRIFKSNKVIITVPAGVLQTNVNDEDYIEFKPAIPEHTAAAKNIGFGSVIKIILEFSENFWNKEKKNAGFIFTDEIIPTWWSQLPVETILTGWIGGEKAGILKHETDDEILDKALQSLANAFAISTESLKEKLKAAKVFNWCKEPDIGGGYSYNTTESVAAKKILQQPVNNTLFFAGEAFFESVPGGTVEAALSSGKVVAQQVLKTLQ